MSLHESKYCAFCYATFPWKIPSVSCFLLGNLFSFLSYSQLHNCAKLLFLIFTFFSIFTNFHFLSVFSSPTFSCIGEEPESSEVSEAIDILHKTALLTFLNIMRLTCIGKVELCQKRKHLDPQKKDRKRRVKTIVKEQIASNTYLFPAKRL